MIMIFKSEGGGSAGGGESELIDYFLPKFVMGDRLASSLLADCFVEFVEIEFLPSDLRYFDLCDALGGPVLCEVLLKFVLLF